MKAIWNNKVIVESNYTVVIENNHYFPYDSNHKDYFKQSDLQSVCPWKGTAYLRYFRNGKQNSDAVWFCPKVSELAKGIKNHVAFWRGVQIED